METLDLLITKFREYKEELAKGQNPPLLHDTVEGFMTGLKALPKGSPERGRFITQHMNHGPFLNALNAHPEGKKMHGMLTNHLNSTANAGFTPGATKVVAKSEDELDDLVKTYTSPFHRWGPSKPVIRGGSADTHSSGMIKPAAKPAPAPAKAAPAPVAPAKPAAAPAKPTGSDKIAAVSKEKIHGISEKQGKVPAPKLTGLDRIRAESQRPIEAMNAKVKKDEESDDEVNSVQKGLFSPKTEAPKKPFTPSFKGHNAALGVGTSTNASGVTTERSFDPLKQETSQKKYISMPFGKTVNGSYSAPANGSSGGASDMQMSRDEKLSLSKNGQWSLDKGDYGRDSRGRELNGPERLPDPPHKPKFKGSDLQIKRMPDGRKQIQLPEGSGSVAGVKKSEDLEKTHVGFKALEGKLENEGHSEESAGAIAASIGRKKYGAKKMADMAHKAEGCYKNDKETGEPEGTVAKDENGLKSAIAKLKSETKITNSMNQMRSANPGMTPKAPAPVAKSECGKCHADPCECQTSGVNVEKMDGGDMSVGGGV